MPQAATTGSLARVGPSPIGLARADETKKRPNDTTPPKLADPQHSETGYGNVALP